MPIYEYKCRKCGEKFEMMRSFSADDAEIKCPKCGAKGPERIISLFAAGGGGSEVGCAPSASGG